MTGHPGEQQVVGLDHVSETTIKPGCHYGFIEVNNRMHLQIVIRNSQIGERVGFMADHWRNMNTK